MEQIDELVKLESHIKAINELLNADIPKRRESLVEELSTCDKELCDLYHYIEMNDFSNKEGINLIREVKGTLVKRRQVKRSIESLDSLTTPLCNKIGGKQGLEDVLDSSIKSRNKIHSKTYKPRVRIDLFKKL